LFNKEPMMVKGMAGLAAVVIAVAAVGAVGGCSKEEGAGAAATQATTQAATRPAQTPVLAANTVLSADVPYGGPDAKLDVADVYAPRDVKGAPVVLFIHGGEWSRGDKHDVSSKPKYFNEHDVVFVAANYRLSPAAVHPAQVDDVATAIGWVHKHIAEYGGDPEKLVIVGHSAGCHLVTYVSLNPEPLAKAGLTPKEAIRGTVAWSGGMYDLVDRYKGGGMYKPFIEATFGADEQGQRAGSPLTYAKNAAQAPPFLVASVDDDKSQSSREAAARMVEAINGAGGKATPALLKGKSHFTANHELGAAGDTSIDILMGFVREVTEKGHG
jgi:acetyl esterase/lipase